ncbi:hypothetical protein [Frankia sp. AiPa1]|uniref:hypothetical protein n=1 Tax=Frankia sp. AiPa1 TaxID=573492 RepID=UPI00202B6FF2|nr:hypothetical protein [Frankia sp. AiPa1]MCL9759114.1 hypothetical protein [Frankia sp. AiPa1]
MSVPALIATLTALFAGTAGEAGAQVWQSLVGLIRRTFGSGSPARDLVEREPAELEADPNAIQTLSLVLAAQALHDPAFAEALRSWTAAVTPDEGAAGSVTNVVGDHARVDGGLVQTRTVYGNITLGGTDHGN